MDLRRCYKMAVLRLYSQFLQRLSNGINILARDDPIPSKFGPKGTDPQ